MSSNKQHQHHNQPYNNNYGYASGGHHSHNPLDINGNFVIII